MGVLDSCNVERISDLLSLMGFVSVNDANVSTLFDAWFRVVSAANALKGAHQFAATKLATLLEALVGEDVDRIGEQQVVSKEVAPPCTDLRGFSAVSSGSSDCSS